MIVTALFRARTSFVYCDQLVKKFVRCFATVRGSIDSLTFSRRLTAESQLVSIKEASQLSRNWFLASCVIYLPRLFH